MYAKSYYKDRTKEEVMLMMEIDGFKAKEFLNPPDFTYESHSHPQAKLIAVLGGSIYVKVEGKNFHCTEGDKILIEPNKEHSAVVGENGCTFLWAEKLLNKNDSSGL